MMHNRPWLDREIQKWMLEPGPALPRPQDWAIGLVVSLTDEVRGGPGYRRIPIPELGLIGGRGRAINTHSVTLGPSADSQVVIGIGVWDSVEGGNLLYATEMVKSATYGDSVEFLPGSIDLGPLLSMLLEFP